MDNNLQNIDWVERVGRFALGMGLIIALLIGEGPLGWWATLPLIAIYPSLTAVLGWDPVYALVARDDASRGGVHTGRRAVGDYRTAV